ncbi:hypothetical protein [Streptomyces adustus]
MAHTFDELVEMQRAADEAHSRVLELQDACGRPTLMPWSAQQTEEYQRAWQHWRELAGAVQAAVTGHAREQDTPRFDIEAAVRNKAWHPQPEPAAA